MELAKQQWEQQEQERILLAIEERNQAVVTLERMTRMKLDADIFLSKILAERKNIYTEKLKEFETRLNEEKNKRLQERKAQRKIERKLKWEQERAEAIERKREEELRIKMEEEKKQLEEERMKREEEEKIKKAEEEAKEAERLAKLERQAEIIRARDAEIERKLEEERRKDYESDTWRKNDRGGSFRDRDTRDNRDIKASSDGASWRTDAKDDTAKLRDRDERGGDDDRNKRRSNIERSDVEERRWGSDRFASKDKERERFDKAPPTRGMGGGNWRRGGEERKVDDRRDDNRLADRGDRSTSRRIEGLKRNDEDRPRYQRSSGSNDWRSRNAEESARDSQPKRDE